MAKYKNIYVFSGIFIYNDLAEYEIHFSNGYINISNILNRVYNSNNNYIEIKIMNCCKLIYNEKGNLLKRKDNNGILSYHINGCNLDLAMFNNVDEDLEITIYAEAEETGDKYSYGKQQTTNQVK
jgi:hypothetical protein